jgi:hypothetical protein
MELEELGCDAAALNHSLNTNVRQKVTSAPISKLF